MGFGFGPGNAMQRDYNRNRSMLNKRKDLKDINEKYGSKDREPFQDKTLTPEELHAFRKNFLKQKKKENLRLTIVFATVLVMISAFAWYLLT